MHVFGLTGGIASGKSTVAKLFVEAGVPVVDADEVARAVVQPGSDGLAAVVAAFGEAVLLPDGTLDRKGLGARVFADAGARATLNGILHPRIAAESGRRIAELDAQGFSLACYDAALIVDGGGWPTPSARSWSSRRRPTCSAPASSRATASPPPRPTSASPPRPPSA